VGASGAIFGLMSAAFIVARHRGLEQLASQIGFYVILNLVFTFGFPGISVGGHLGGLIGGGLAALVITYGERRAARPVMLEVLGMIAISAVSLAGALAAASAA
jgi:membrane associated rhomboid family serine protease